jgi:chromosome segregation ATPase
MTDIVEMLRASDAWALSNATAVMHEAAAEIERLRAQAMRAAAAWEKRTDDWFTATAERNRLREALRVIRDQEPDAQSWSVGVARAALGENKP